MNRSRLYREEKAIESVGWVDADIIVNLFSEIHSHGTYDFFNEKKVMDVGAGFSPLLKNIGQNSRPSSLIAIDPIYDGWDKEQKAIEYTKTSTLTAIVNIMRQKSEHPTVDHTSLENNTRRQLEDTEWFSRETNISYIQDISHVEDNNLQDVIFISSVLYKIDKPKAFLEKIDRVLQKDGVIFIIDFQFRGEIFADIKESHIPIDKKFDTYFVTRLRKGDFRKLVSDPIYYKVLS